MHQRDLNAAAEEKNASDKNVLAQNVDLENYLTR